MTLSDLLTSNFLDNVGAVSLLDMALALVIAFCLGVFIFFVYKKVYQGVMYSTSFGVTLIALTMISTLIILAVTSNVILSLGMVGALSIVRFRTAIKEPIDVAFLFWALAAGIVTAAGLIPLAVCGNLAIGITLILFANRKVKLKPYIAILNCTSQPAEAAAVKLLQDHTTKAVLKSKTIHADHIETTYEVRLKDEGGSLVNRIQAVDGVDKVLLVSYNGDYM